MSICLAPLLFTLGAAEVPVGEVAVYSEQARVTRVGNVAANGRVRTTIAVLPSTADPGSARLELLGGKGEVERVEIERVAEEALPEDEARELLRELEAIDLAVARLQRDRDTHARAAAVVAAIKPALPGPESPRPRPRLDPTGWAAVLAFVSQWGERAGAEVRRIDAAVEELARKRVPLAERAATLGAGGRRDGHRVVATLRGQGELRVRLSYMVQRARWLPSYDIQLDPERNQVNVLFAGLVSQESGEDWQDVRLTLSTAQPRRAIAAPKLPSWKIGERERYIPTPRPAPQPAPTPPPPPPAVPMPRPQPAAAQLRQALLQRAHGQPEGATTKVTHDLEMVQAMPHDTRARAAPPPPPPMPRPAPGRAHRSAAPEAAPAMAPAATMAPPEFEESDRESDQESRVAQVSTVSAGPPAQAISFAPPPSYRPPPLAPHLPAALAGGYDLAWDSAGREIVGTGKGTRRIALFSRSFPVTLERKVFPALAPEAYLVAEIKNPLTHPLPGARAQLFVGGDPAGEAQLAMIAPGQAFTLPLGIDRAIKPVRNVQLKQREQGIISKEELTDYAVTIELVNPHPAAIAVRVVDQIPVNTNKTVAVENVRSEPSAALDAKTGALEWRLPLKPGQKTIVKFFYTLRRPRGHRLRP